MASKADTACEPSVQVLDSFNQMGAHNAKEEKEGPSSVMVKYNHYNQIFPLSRKGELDWEVVDEQYCISFVFKGAFGKKLRHVAEGNLVEHDEHGHFCGLIDGAQYELVVTEDEKAEEEARLKQGDKPRRKLTDNSVSGITNASKLLTEELKGLSVEELRAGSDRYKALLEARDLEDCLYGNG